MNKKDIKIGQIYVNTDPKVKGVKFIGVGEMHNRKPRNQQMVVMRNSRIVIGPRHHPIRGFWDKFKEI